MVEAYPAWEGVRQHRCHLLCFVVGLVVRDVMEITFGVVVAAILVTNPHAFR